MVEDELLNLKYKKVYIRPCQKEKILLPAHVFNKNTLGDMYRICLQPQKNDILLYRKIKAIESYLVEVLPRSFVNFLSSRYASLCIVNNAYAFIIQAIESIQFNTNHLFIDIHDRYFDLLLTQNNEVLLFNSFDYGSVTDLIYYTLNCLQQCHIDKENVHTSLSGNLVNDPDLLTLMNKYIPNVSILNCAPLSQLVRNNELNNSSFIHLLNIHKCE